MTTKNFIFVANRVARTLLVEVIIVLLWVGLQYMRNSIADIDLLDIFVSLPLSWYISKDIIKIEKKIHAYDELKRAKQI